MFKRALRESFEYKRKREDSDADAFDVRVFV